jgi:hypothetical protein
MECLQTLLETQGVGAEVAQLLYTQMVIGSIPILPTKNIEWRGGRVWLKAPHLKCDGRESVPRVRIPVSLPTQCCVVILYAGIV